MEAELGEVISHKSLSLILTMTLCVMILMSGSGCGSGCLRQTKERLP